MGKKKRSTGFLAGVASLGKGMSSLGEGLILIFGGPVRPRNSFHDPLERSSIKNVYGNKTGFEADAAALRSDWDAVHNDLQNAFDNVIDDKYAPLRDEDVRD